MILKVCRVKDISTARLCGDIGVDMIGLHAINFLPSSRARIFARIVRNLAYEYPEMKPVLVTKVTSPIELAWMVSQIGIKNIQIHIRMDLDDLKILPQAIADKTRVIPRLIPVIAAQDSEAVKYAEDLRQIIDLFDFFLVDSGWRGGTGQIAPYETL